jgi:dimethylhistidine N-methyltransferase
MINQPADLGTNSKALSVLPQISADESVPVETIKLDTVIEGLTGASQKTLPSSYLYDAVGSALFEAICHLREYGCCKGEKSLLSSYRRQIIEYLDPRARIIELGAGSGEKARLLLAELERDVEFHAIDISPTALTNACQAISCLPRVIFHAHAMDFLHGLRSIASKIDGGNGRSNRRAPEPILVLFLGSSIGNFSRSESSSFLQSLRAVLDEGDMLLLGTDLIKPIEKLMLAYDDPQGVTAAFNRNVLSRLNADFGASFDLPRFKHSVKWNAESEAVELYLESLCDQIVAISAAGLSIHFKRGETILTEMSHKYRPEKIGEWVRQAGFSLLHQWIDQETAFALNMLAAS